MSSNSNVENGIEDKSVVYRDGFNWARTDKLEPNPWNPNVMDNSTLQMLKVNLQGGNYDPLVVSPSKIFYGPEAPDPTVYIVVDGEQRLTAAKELNIEWLKVDVKHLPEADAREECYSRGAVRGQLDPIKEGHLFDLEVEALGSEALVAEKYTRSRSYIAGRRSLTRAPEVVKQLLREPEKAFVALKKEEIAATIVEANPQEEYTEEQMTEMVDTSIEMGEFETVPRGTLTASHLEAIAGLPETPQKSVAAKILEENLTVRETEILVKMVKEKIARRERFEKALEKAVQKVCPKCGSPPKDFEEKMRWGDEGREDYYDETSFACSRSVDAYCYSGNWDYMEDFSKRKAKEEKRALEASKEQSTKLSAARLNPGYIRRAEDHKELFESMRPWVLRKVQQIEELERVSITGKRADGKMVRIEYPTSFGSKLSFMIGNEGEMGYWQARKSFSFDIEKKNYKSLPFNSKLDTKATPENRAAVHRFLDDVIHTDEDPWLPEDPEEVKAILIKYGEAEVDPEPEPRPECFGQWFTDEAPIVEKGRGKGKSRCFICKKPLKSDCKVETAKTCQVCGRPVEECDGKHVGFLDDGLDEADQAQGEDDARAREEAAEKDQEDLEDEAAHREGSGPEGP